ncbi:MAG: zf-TFIIB domain-containing protein [Candidatus Methanomethylicaceae archaeon]
MLKCPVCQAELIEIQKYNVFIDVCKNCKGIWLDRGELEKIIELSKINSSLPKQQSTEYLEYEPQESIQYKYQKEYSKHKKYQDYNYLDEDKKYYKRKSKYKDKLKIIESIFDIFD